MIMKDSNNRYTLLSSRPPSVKGGGQYTDEKNQGSQRLADLPKSLSLLAYQGQVWEPLALMVNGLHYILLYKNPTLQKQFHA